MEKALTKHFWVINLLTLAAVAYMTAAATGQLVAASAAEMLPAPEPQGTALSSLDLAARDRDTYHRRDGSDILERNIFDSTVGPVIPTEQELSEIQTTSGDGELPLVPCEAGSYAVLATVASANNPQWSFATVSVNNQSELYRIGDAIDDRTVSNITWRYLFLRGATDECYVDLFGSGEEQSNRRKKPSRAVRSKSDIAKGIQVDGPNERTVDRAVVDAALANPARFARSVRVRPYKRNGEVSGFRLRRIRRGSPLEMLGAKKGDIIHSVNGVDLTSVDKALAAYQSLRSENQLQFDVTRKGKPTTLTINIR
ncbi:MAG: type II secretion system protein GspC [Polyangia bacterium]